MKKVNISFSSTTIFLQVTFIICRNPDQPEALPNGIPEWPQYDTASNKFMELNSTDTKVITTPHKERLDLLSTVLGSARKVQHEADSGKIISGYYYMI